MIVLKDSRQPHVPFGTMSACTLVIVLVLIVYDVCFPTCIARGTEGCSGLSAFFFPRPHTRCTALWALDIAQHDHEENRYYPQTGEDHTGELCVDYGRAFEQMKHSETDDDDDRHTAEGKLELQVGRHVPLMFFKLGGFHNSPADNLFIERRTSVLLSRIVKRLALLHDHMEIADWQPSL
jgi:hypothetical protein